MFEVKRNTATTRKKNPTAISKQGNIDLPRRSAYRRQIETLDASAAINGGSIVNKIPALDGMFSTIIKYANVHDIAKYCSQRKFKNCFVSEAKKEVGIYEKSEDNFVRSLSLLYAGGVIGKNKYIQAKSALVMKNSGKCTRKGYLSKERIKIGCGIPIPKPFAYEILINHIEKLDIGEIISLDTLCAGLPFEHHVDGVYRDLENLLLLLCHFYFKIDPFRKESEKLVWFGENEGSFKVAIGGDGAPFGNWEESMAWLVSLLNVGPRVASPNDNFLLFGANCKEDHKVVKLFTSKLVKDIAVIEQKSYTVLEKQVKFTFELVPSDMKFTAFLNGELNNAATYFSSFANVCHADCTVLDGKFGTSPDCIWKPGVYEDRVAVAKQVTMFKSKLPNVTKQSQRSKITQFIAGKHSRQEFLPIIGKLCDKTYLEPLHLKNNAVKHLHALFLKLAISISNLPAKLNNISELPENCAMSRYMKAMHGQVNATRLNKQLERWLLDGRARDKDFSYRLTGKDSKLVLHGFMFLINAIKGDSEDPRLLCKLMFLAFLATKLRDCVAYFSMYHITEENLLKLPSLAKDYFTAVALFSGHVSPTVWSIGYLVPVHTKWLFDKFGTGLGINTMQGREAKHVQIASYAKNSLFKQRWYQVFRHDYISKVWLPLRQPSLLAYHQARDTLIPPRVLRDPEHYCYCGFTKDAGKDACFYCDHSLMTEIRRSVSQQKPTKVCLKYMS